MNVNDSRKGEGGDRKPGISAILTATQNPYSFTPRPIPLSLSPSPLPSAAGGRRRGRRLKPPPATAWKSCSCKKKKKKKRKKSRSCHLPSGVRMAHFCRVVFGPRSRCGGWLRGAGARWRPGNRARGGLRTASPVRVAPGLGCRHPCAPATRSLRAPTRRRYPQPPVAKGGENASAQVAEKPRLCWNPAREAQLLALLLGP